MLARIRVHAFANTLVPRTQLWESQATLQELKFQVLEFRSLSLGRIQLRFSCFLLS